MTEIGSRQLSPPWLDETPHLVAKFVLDRFHAEMTPRDRDALGDTARRASLPAASR